LYVVATPIGNLEDITLRALKVLATVDLIAAEDTRHTARLLTHYQIRTPLISCHEHNEHQRTVELTDRIRGGESVALVTDAGTPTVSDPGYRVVSAAVSMGLKVFPIPGVSAVLAALSASGMASDAFVFLGFAPKKKGRRMTLLDSLAAESRTLIFYESPRRIAVFLNEIRSVMGDRQAVLARELTKVHEEFIRGSLSEILSSLAQRQEIKGECTLLICGAASETMSEEELTAVLHQALATPGAHISSLSKRIANQYHLSRKTVYEMALAIQKQNKEPH